MRRHPIRRFFRHLFRTAWWKPNRESRKMLRKEAAKLIGWDKESNPAWAKSWKYFIKRQHPWYGLLELNQYKIIEMRDYMQHYSQICEEATAKQIKEMTEIIDLGNKILNDEYDYPFIKWSKTNSVPVTLIYEKIGEKQLNNSKITLPCEGKLLDKLYNRDIFEDLKNDLNLGLSYGITESDLKQNEKWLEDKQTCSLDLWLKEHNLTRDKIVCAYTSEYTNGKSEEENRQYSQELMQQCWQDRQNDINKYFECIAEGIDHWGD